MARALLLGLSSLALSIAACGARVTDDTGAGSQNANAGANGAGGGATVTTTTTGGGGSTTTGAGGKGGAPAQCEPAPPSYAPGTPLFAPSDEGAGECAGHAVASVLAAVHAKWAELADVSTLWDHQPYDGSFVYAFREPSGALALALKRGGGDCPAGCTENEYWYFEAGAGCAPAQVGHYRHVPGPSCLEAEGEAMWGYPPPLDPMIVCGADNSPQDVSGTYSLHACGQSTDDCAGGTKGAPTAVDGAFGVVVAQDAADLAKGTVTFTGTGLAALDGRAIAATFARRRLHVEEHVQEPGNCMNTHDLVADFDFEGFGAHHLDWMSARSPDCAKPEDYCKGSLTASLFATP